MRTIQQLAQEACDVQNACNVAGVLNSMARVVNELVRDHHLFGDALCEHPIVRAWADKVASLTGIQGSVRNAIDAHEACEWLASGGSVAKIV